MTCLRRVGLEAVEDRLPLALRHLAVILQRAERRQRLGQRLQRLDPLREDDRLAAALGHLRHVGQQLLQLGALAGQRIEVADLLQPHHQLEDVLHRDRVAQLVEMDDALLLGQVVGLALGRRQLQVGVADDLAAACRSAPPPWCGAGCSRAVSAGSSLAGVSGGMRSGSTKAKMLTRSSVRFSMGVPVMAQLRVAARCCARPGPSSTRGS